MTVSHADRSLPTMLLGLVALLGALQLAWPAAQAQDREVGRPILLMPRLDTDQPDRLTPRQAEEALSRPDRETIEGVEIEPLQAPVPDALGVMPGDREGFDSNLWVGTDRDVLLRLLQQLPLGIGSPTLRGLARRLLLTTADPPGIDATAQPGDGDGEFLALRVDALRRLGDLQGLQALLAVVPNRLDSEAMARARAEAAWLSGDLDAACRQVRNAVGAYLESTYWAKALISCQLIAEETDQAALGLDLLREQSGEADAVFLGVATAVLGLGQNDVAADQLLEQADPFSLALLGRLEPDLPENWVDQAPVLALQTVVAFSTFTLEDRTLAAERLVAMAALDPQALAALYGAFAVTSSELDGAIDVSAGVSSARGRAVLYQAAQQDNLPAAQAELLHLALTEVWSGRLYQAGLRCLGPNLAEIRPTPAMAWFSTTAGRGLFTLGRTEQAAGWLLAAEEQAPRDPEAETALIALWPYAQLAGVGQTRVSLQDWLQSRSEAGDAAVALRLDMTVALAALGEPNRPSWAELAADEARIAGAVPAVAPLLGIGDAAVRGQTGIALLLILGQLGPVDLQQAGALTLGATLSGLAYLGLDWEARSLAIEMALAKGY